MCIEHRPTSPTCTRSRLLRRAAVFLAFGLSGFFPVPEPAAQNLTQAHYRWRNDDGVEQGSTPIQVSATADTTTTGTTDVAVSGMTVTPGAGDYLVWFSGSVEGIAGGSTQNVSLYVNGVQLAHGERQVFTEAYL